MLRRPAPPHHDRVSVVPPAGLDFHPAYLAAYDELYAERPEHRAYAQPEGRDDLAEAAAAGGLFEIRVDGQAAGLVAGYRAEEQGMRGFLVGEFLLTRPFRGRGLGPAAQRRFAEALPREAGDVLMGTITEGNLASLATAKRCGREEIGGWLWVDLD
jgi:GNAT superfamily N-acetyltransferase